MRIVHIAPYYAPAYAFGGVVSAVEGLASAQAARGDSVTVLTTDAGDLGGRRIAPMRDVRDGVQIIRCPNLSSTLRARYNLSTPRKFAAIVRALAAKCDVLHLHELRTAEAWLTVRYAPPHARIVLSPHGTLSHATGRSSFKRAWDRLLGRPIMARVNAVAALTAFEAGEVRDLWTQRGLTPPPITIVPNGVGQDVWAGLNSPDLVDDIEALHAKYQFTRPGRINVLFLGRLHERKGLQFLIPAFYQALVQHHAEYAEDVAIAHANLLVIGPDAGMAERVRQMVVEFNPITDEISADFAPTILTGALVGRERIAALAASHIFVLPAVGEGLPMAALEAAAAGCALILTEAAIYLKSPRSAPG